MTRTRTLALLVAALVLLLIGLSAVSVGGAVWYIEDTDDIGISTNETQTVHEISTDNDMPC